MSIGEAVVRGSGRVSMPVVAHCATPFLWDGGGSWIHNQIVRLRRWRPVVLTQEARHLDRFPVPELYTAEDFGFGRRLVNRAWRRWTGQYLFYDGILRRTGARLVHAHFGYQGCRCLAAARSCHLPLVTTFYGADATAYTRLPQWRQPYARLFAEGRMFLAEGSALAAHVAAAGAPPDRIRLQHLGVDTARIRFRERRPRGPVRILMCGHFRPKKGIAEGLLALGRAWQSPSGVDLRIRLIGDGPEREHVRDAVANAGLADRVESLGVVPYDVVLQSIEWCDLLLQPSRTAADGDAEGGAPVILLEAQAAGVPVVSTTHADIPEYVVDGGSGWLAPEGDDDALVEVLRLALNQVDRWPSMGRRGRAHVVAEYDADRQAACLEELYDELGSA